MSIIYNRKFNKSVRKILRNNMTNAEFLLWARLKHNQLGYKFRRQHGIGQFIVDFYCPKIKLCIEIDGEVHRKEDIKSLDIIKQKLFKTLNIKTIRFTNNQVENELFKVINKIVQVSNYLRYKQ